MYRMPDAQAKKQSNQPKEYGELTLRLSHAGTCGGCGTFSLKFTT